MFCFPITLLSNILTVNLSHYSHTIFTTHQFCSEIFVSNRNVWKTVKVWKGLVSGYNEQSVLSAIQQPEELKKTCTTNQITTKSKKESQHFFLFILLLDHTIQDFICVINEWIVQFKNQKHLQKWVCLFFMSMLIYPVGWTTEGRNRRNSVSIKQCWGSWWYHGTVTEKERTQVLQYGMFLVPVFFSPFCVQLLKQNMGILVLWAAHLPLCQHRQGQREKEREINPLRSDKELKEHLSTTKTFTWQSLIWWKSTESWNGNSSS